MEREEYLYRHVPIVDLPSILEEGMNPRRGNNTTAVNDEKTVVFFSEGMEGVIGMAAGFQRTFDKKKKGTEYEDITLDDYLGKRVFLKFSSDGIINENDKGSFWFADGWTSQAISSDIINVCYLRNINTNEIIYDRDSIIKYMMSITPVDSFKHGNDNQKEDIKVYYENRKNELLEFNPNDYVLEDVSLLDFINYLNGTYDLSSSKVK